AGELLRGLLDLGIGSGRSLEIEFRVSRCNSGADRFDSDGRALAYSVEAFELRTAVAPALRDAREAAAEILRSRSIPPPFCTLPFTQLYVNEGGKVLPCCIMQEEIAQHGDPLHVDASLAGDRSAQELWNLPLNRSIRKEMLNGVRPRACAKCFALEDAGADSHRTWANREFQAEAMAALPLLRPDGEIDAPPAVIDARLGNLCNLKCRMCSPVASLSLADEYAEIYGVGREQFRENPWYKNKDLIQKLAQACGHGRLTLTLAGGEPLAIPQFAELQRLLIDRGLAKNIHLHVFTNGTTISPKATALFPPFREISYLFSLDGEGETNEFIRYPSSFAKINATLRALHDQPQPYNLSGVQFNTTVQLYNIFGIPSLLRYLSGFPQWDWLPSLSPLTFPEMFSVLVLPEENRKLARTALARYLSEEAAGEGRIGKVSHATIRERVGALMQYLESGDHSHLLPEFHRVNRIYDARRSQTFTGIPGLAFTAEACP
ncbi:MAG: twitch domain-containing radical SAM protein, partial [Bdellovibrionota bacterium]